MLYVFMCVFVIIFVFIEQSENAIFLRVNVSTGKTRVFLDCSVCVIDILRGCCS